MFPYRATELSPDEWDAQVRSLGGLADSVRRLMRASLVSELPLAELDEIAASIDELSARLEQAGAYEPRAFVVNADGRLRSDGNAVVGLRNPIAPPLRIVQDKAAKRCRSEFTLGPLYEGPPGCVHGGMVALVLDQLLGEGAAAGGTPGMTATLRIDYRRPTRLGDLVGEAWVVESDGVKTVVRGHLLDPEGTLTAEAEGLFVLPRWAREAIARGDTPRPERFE